MAKKTDGSLEKLRQNLRDGKLLRVYLLFGEEAYLKEYYCKAIREQVLTGVMDDFNYIVLEGEKTDLDLLRTEIDTPPMLAEKKMILVKYSGIFKSASEAVKTFWSETLSDLPEYLCLVFYEEEADKRGVLYKAVNANGLAVDCAYMEGSELINWVERSCRSAGKKMSRETVEYLIKNCDNGMHAISRELEKLYAYGEETITIKDIDRLVTKLPQSRVFEMIDCIMKRDAEGMFSLLEQAKTLKESPFMILENLCGYFSKILHTQFLLQSGVTPPEIASKIKVPPFFARDYIDYAKRFSCPFLTQAIQKINTIDYEIKCGRARDWLSIEQFLANCILYQKKG